MNCPECGHEVVESSAFCGDCGVRLPRRDAVAVGGTPADVPALLTRANLLRVRGQWEAAAETCAEVMRLDPRNAPAHSLLGEIYDNQGLLERAIRWYEEALELNPNSAADRAKLARARELLQSRTRAGSRSPFSWLRVAGMAGVILCGGIILLAALFARNGAHPEEPLPTATPVAQRASVRRVPRLVYLTNQERDVCRQVVPAVRAPLELQSFEIDPREQRHAVRVTLATDAAIFKAGRTTGAARDALRLEGYRIAHRIAEAFPSTSLVDLVVAARTAGGATGPQFDYLFAGVLPADSLTVPPEVVTPADLTRIYRHQWWNTQLAW